MTKTVLIFGPTAIGKTNYSIDFARKNNGEIISADSMQVYRYMDIGTAKPSKEQRKEVPHYLIDIVDPDEDWTVSDFIERTNACIKDISSRGKLPIIVGGTGLYLNAFINGYSFPIAARDSKIRDKLSELIVEDLYEKLKFVDPKAAEKINKNDKKRIIRALEVYEQTGIPISQLQVKTPHPSTGSGQVAPSRRMLCLTMDRSQLYGRINARVDKMISDGLVNEVTSLLNRGYNKDLQSMQALGYKEMMAHLEGKTSLEDTIALIKQKTRNFARRQLTWFRKFEKVEWIEA